MMINVNNSVGSLSAPINNKPIKVENKTSAGIEDKFQSGNNYNIGNSFRAGSMNRATMKKIKMGVLCSLGAIGGAIGGFAAGSAGALIAAPVLGVTGAVTGMIAGIALARFGQDNSLGDIARGLGFAIIGATAGAVGGLATGIAAAGAAPIVGGVTGLVAGAVGGEILSSMKVSF